MQKVKVILHVAYAGSTLHGFQKQVGPYRTIEGELERALEGAGALSEEEDLSKVHWSKAARTDKGVSAAANVVGCLVSAASLPDLADRLNQHLPAQIRVLGARLAEPDFDARRSCRARQYEYLLPLWAFDPKVAVPRSAKKAEQQQQQQGLGSTNGCVGVQAAASSSFGHVGRPLEAGDTDRGSALKAFSSGQEDLFGITTDGRAGEALAVVAAPGTAAGTDPVSGKGCETETGAASSSGAGAAADAGPSELAGPESQQKGRRSAAKHKRERQAQRGPHAGGQEWAPGDAARRATANALQEASGSTFKLEAPQLEQLNSVLASFQGTHSYHNFTNEAVEPGSAEAVRTVIRFSCDGIVDLPALRAESVAASATCTVLQHSTQAAAAGAGCNPREAPLPVDGQGPAGATFQSHPACPHPARDSSVQGTDQMTGSHDVLGSGAMGFDASAYPQSVATPAVERYVRLVIHGRSFMMHQIRKMVGLALAVARGVAPADSVSIALDTHVTKIKVPTAPSTGLLMERAQYDKGETAADVQAEDSALAAAAEAFKHQRIYPDIAAVDPAETWLFLKGLNEAAFRFSTWPHELEEAATKRARN